MLDGEFFGELRGEARDQRFRERQDFVHVSLRLDGNKNVEATAAGSFGKGFELQHIKNFSESQAGARGVAEFSRWRIHIETNPVGLAQGRGAAPGYVNGDATEIRQRKLSGERASDHVVCGFTGLANVSDPLGGRAGWQ